MPLPRSGKYTGTPPGTHRRSPLTFSAARHFENEGRLIGVEQPEHLRKQCSTSTGLTKSLSP
jgi:hypothetical protein